ncbi:OmpA family protein [Risungbinella massiliensis]|uniref:OmpA family protein n=1 Tax=Risungbinella massiliensis TaxID=1329796 RepID=UPI00069BBDFD|nr:OmpA family protein [Risungbinella massiliensis]
MSRGMRTNRRDFHQAKGNYYYQVSHSVHWTSFLLCFLLFFFVFVMNGKESSEAMETPKDTTIEKQLEVKSEIIHELVKSFQDSHLQMEIDEQTGTITFHSGVLFDSDSATISPEGHRNLAAFVPQYMSILLSDKFRNEISQIVIEGHTDQTGGYLYNMKLSQDRASAVAIVIYDNKFPDFPHKQELPNIITTIGRSYNDPKITPDGKVDATASRRVEFTIRLKDEKYIEEQQNLVKPNDN